MALVLKDRVKETSVTTGTGTITLAGASSGYQAFSVIGNGNTTYYTITDPATGDWEVGIGTYTSSGTTLSRTTVLSSSNAGSLVNFAAGTKDVFCVYPAEKAVYEDASNKVVQNDFVDLGVSGTATINAAALTTGTVSTTPSSDTDIANKQYVDGLVASGIYYHTPVRVESPIALTVTYNNGSSGVGATLTNAGTQAALVIDGVSLSVSDRVLIYAQTNQTQNGIYTVTTVGSGVTNWVLTRSTDANSYGLTSPNNLGEGSTVFVQQGTSGAGETYTCNTVGVITFGTTNITFVQISSAQIYSVGTGLTLAGTQFSITPVGTAATYGSASSVPVITTNASGQVSSVTNTSININANQVTAGTLAVAQGGTNLSSYNVGDIVYASGTGTLAGLADAATGNVLLSGGTNTAPLYGKVNLGTHISGTLPILAGGTGATVANGAMANLMGFTSTATVGGTTTLTNASSYYQVFTGTLAQTVILPVTSTLQQGWSFHIVNNSTQTLTIQSSGLNNVYSPLPIGTTVMVTCILTTGTTAASWEAGLTDFSTNTGTGAVTLNTGATMIGAMNFTGSATSNSNFGTANTTGTLIIGGTSQTGALTVGQSTVSQTTNIQAGATASASTKTVNIGTGGLAGSTTTIGIGSTFGTAVTANGTWTYSTPLVATNMVQSTTSTSGYLSSTDWNTFNNKSNTNGTVTSVATSGTVSGLTLTGGTITTTGTITLGGTLAVTASNFASQTANTFLAAPNGAPGVPTFRALLAADVPTLNQNTTGTASNVTGTVAIANGGTGATTAAAARTAFGATTVGSNMFTLVNPSAITFPRFNADNTVSALDAATFRTAIGAGTSSTTGTVTSITGGTYLTGGTITTSGTLTVDATSTNTASKVVARDGSGNFAAGTITATTFSGALSGNATTATTASNATQAGGFTPSQTNGTANRIVVADGSGYINNNYFNSSDNSVTGSVTGVMVKQGDNYLRTGTAAAIATFISGQTMNIAGSSTTATSLNSSNFISQTGSSGNFNTDFSNTPAGTYRYNGDSATATNNPGGTWWIVENMRHTNTSSQWGTQVAWGWEDNANRLATRNVQGGTFGGWVYYLNSSNYTTYAPSLTGTGASGTWGINVTGSSGSTTNAVNLSGGTVSATTISASGGITATSAGPFFLNATTVSANFTIPASFNATSAGPITINTGVTVTVSTGSAWVVV